MADVTKTATTQPENGAITPEVPDQQPKIQEPEKTVSKDIFDKKVSEMNKKISELNAALKLKMTEEEKAAAIQAENAQALADAKNEIARLKTTTALTAAGIKSELSEKLAAAIISNESEGIVSVIKEVLSDNAAQVEAKVRKEILSQGSPDGVKTGGNPKEQADKNADFVKSIVAPKEVTPLEKTKWF